MKGMLVSFYRCADGRDCTNGGVSAQAVNALLIGEGIPQIFEGTSVDTVLELKKKNIYGEYVYAVPLIAPGDDKSGMVGPMFGGNFIYTSDSRFPNRYPIPVHDRWEYQGAVDIC